MSKIGFFYGSHTGKTESIASMIQAQLGTDVVDIHAILDVTVGDFADYQDLIIGVLTWNVGELSSDWEDFFPDLDDIDFQGKIVAYFVVGDQTGYPDRVHETIGILEEKIDVWADFSKLKVGTELALNSLACSGAENAGGSNIGGTTGSGKVPELGAAMMLFNVKIERAETAILKLPSKLADLPLLRPADATNAAQPRPVELSLQGMKWAIDGQPFEMTTATPQETVKLNAIEQWEIINKLNPGATMDAQGMAYPIHFHGVKFQVISRQVLPELAAGWQTV